MTQPGLPGRHPHHDDVAAALERARERLAQAAEGSPDWEAAIDGLEALERELAALEETGSREDLATRRLVRHVGPFSLADRHVVQGTLVGGPEEVEAMVAECAALAGRAPTRAAFVEELARIAARSGFVLETGIDGWGGITLYAWEQAGG